MLQHVKMGWFGVVRDQPRSSTMSPFYRAHMISNSSLIETVRLSCTVSFSRYDELFVEIRQFRHTPPAFGGSDGVDPVRFSKIIWDQKTRVPGLPCSVVCAILCLTVLVELRLVTDTDTQTQTDTDRHTDTRP